MAPIYEEIYQDMVKLMDANTEHGDKLEKILTMVELIKLIAIIAVIALAIFVARRIGRVLAQNIVDPVPSAVLHGAHQYPVYSFLFPVLHHRFHNIPSVFL